MTAGPAVALVSQIQDNTQALYAGAKEIVWSLSHDKENLAELLQRLQDFGVELFEGAGIDFEGSRLPAHFSAMQLPSEKSRNLLLIFKEAMNNALKYSGASAVKLGIRQPAEGDLLLRLEDNGRGFDPVLVKRGEGLSNMAARARRIGAELHVHSAPGQGVVIILNIPLN